MIHFLLIGLIIVIGLVVVVVDKHNAINACSSTLEIEKVRIRAENDLQQQLYRHQELDAIRFQEEEKQIYSSLQDARDNQQDTRNNQQDARNNKQDARNNKQDARNNKQDARNKE